LQANVGISYKCIDEPGMKTSSLDHFVVKLLIIIIAVRLLKNWHKNCSEPACPSSQWLFPVGRGEEISK
jgi:hypothetical protein